MRKKILKFWLFVKYFEQVRRETAVVEAKRYEISLESAPQAIIQIYFALTTGILTTTMMIGKYFYNSIKHTCSIKPPGLDFSF